MPSFFVPTPGDLTALESPTREFAIQGKKNANAWGSARGGGGGGGVLKRILSSRSRDIQKSAKIKKNWNKAALRQLVHEKTG